MGTHSSRLHTPGRKGVIRIDRPHNGRSWSPLWEGREGDVELSLGAQEEKK